MSEEKPTIRLDLRQSFAEMAETVLREWTRAHTVDARERLYRSLREQYTVTIAPVQDAALTRGRR